MGYSTDFRGEFKINKKVDEETYKLLVGLALTRRVKRSGLPKKYGVDGEFYFEESDFDNFGQSETPKEGKIVNNNEPPSTQPGLWLQWQIQEDHETIIWDRQEKFYNYIEWIIYIIDKILKPRGYVLEGRVDWRGEEWDDNGTITIKDNKISTR